MTLKIERICGKRKEGPVLQRNGEDVVLVRRGVELFAVDANCTHYHGISCNPNSSRPTFRRTSVLVTEWSQ